MAGGAADVRETGRLGVCSEAALQRATPGLARTGRQSAEQGREAADMAKSTPSDGRAVTIVQRVGVNPRSVSAYKQALRRDPCSYCGGPADVLDHITPLIRFGANTW